MKPSTGRRAGEAVSIASTLSMRRADKVFVGGDRIGLLEAIDRFGSITRAAREVGVSKRFEGQLGDGEPFYSLVRRVAMRVSARNLLCGTVDRIEPGAGNTEVMVVLPGGSVVMAIVTKESAKWLSLAKGDHVCALVKASSVILGVDA